MRALIGVVGALCACILAALAVSCVSPRTGIGGQCDLNSECESPLICRFERCRRDCVESRDCPPGLACVLDDDRSGACLIVEETRCASAAQCPDPLVCSFGRCSNRCEGDRDCVSPQRCEDDPATGLRACFASNAVETPCVEDSECEGASRCYPDGRCRPQCLVDRDCRPAEVCERAAAGDQDNVCVPAADAGMDAGDVGVDAAMDSAMDSSVDAGVDSGSDADVGMDAGTDTALPFDGGAVVPRPCGTAADCVAPNATTDCIASNCQITACDPGYADCDRDPLTGCHAPLDSWLACGSCANYCGAGRSCSGVTCGSEAITSMAAGVHHTCVVRSSGAVACWGLDADGQLGDGAITRPPGDMIMPTTEPVPAVIYPSVVTGLTDAVEVSAGLRHTCARKSDGTVVCWGGNGYGQVGPAGTIGSPSLTPVPVTGLSGVAQVAVGTQHGCVRLTNGEVRCWGYNRYGTLGDGSMTDSATAVTVVESSSSSSPLTMVADLDGGRSHVCAALVDGTVRCWGQRNRGQLGTGGGTSFSPSGTPTPVVVTGLSGAVEVATSTQSSCARLGDGTVSCWGDGGFGELGDGLSAVRTTAGTVPGLTGVVELSGGSFHYCARLGDGTLRCWGRSEYGAAGDGSAVMEHSTPVSVLGLSNAASVTTGAEHTCALLTTGAVSCWGGNSFGQIADLSIGCCAYLEGVSCFDVCDESRVPRPAEGL